MTALDTPPPAHPPSPADIASAAECAAARQHQTATDVTGAAWCVVCGVRVGGVEVGEVALQLGKLSIDLIARSVAVNGQQVFLTGKEYSILEVLALRKGQVMTRDALLSHLYGDEIEPGAKIIDVFVSKLRKKLANAGERSVIGSVWGRGYVVRATP